MVARAHSNCNTLRECAPAVVVVKAALTWAKKKMPGRPAAYFLLSLACAWSLVGMASGQGGPVPLLVAHRGDSTFFPENTLEAFASADAKTADILETDVYLSGDGEVMAIHDSTVTRTTDRTGRVDSFTVSGPPYAMCRHVDPASPALRANRYMYIQPNH